MSTYNSQNSRFLRYRLVYIALFIKSGYDLYHDIKQSGFNGSATINAAIILCLVILYAIDLFYDKKRQGIPRLTVMLILGISLCAFATNSYLDIKQVGFNYSTIASIAIIIYLVTWCISILVYDMKGWIIPKAIKISLLVLFLSVIIITLILSTVDRNKLMVTN